MVVRITVQDRAAWHALLEQTEVKAAADREYQRRSYIAAKLGKLAASKPNHISKRGRTAAKAQSTAPSPIPIAKKIGRPRKQQQEVAE
jgi:hypothetical protein